MAKLAWKTKEQIDSEKLEQKWDALRAKRDELLKETDFTQLPDAPFTEQEKVDIANYRQALRDLPEKTNDIDNPVFPEKPVCMRNSI